MDWFVSNWDAILTILNSVFILIVGKTKVSK